LRKDIPSSLKQVFWFVATQKITCVVCNPRRFNCNWWDFF